MSVERSSLYRLGGWDIRCRARETAMRHPLRVDPRDSGDRAESLAGAFESGLPLSDDPTSSETDD